MCIYRDQLTNEQKTTLASILTDPPAANIILWSNVLDLFRAFNKVQTVSEMNGKIRVVCLCSGQPHQVAFIDRPRKERHVDSYQVRQIREFLDMLEISRDEEL